MISWFVDIEGAVKITCHALICSEMESPPGTKKAGFREEILPHNYLIKWGLDFDAPTHILKRNTAVLIQFHHDHGVLGYLSAEDSLGQFVQNTAL
jgi:hypothetical protein